MTDPFPGVQPSSSRFVFFDCDSTLTAVEGIDELARLKGQHEYIAELTRRAMEGEIDLEDVFAERLAILRPTRGEIRKIAKAYCAGAVPHAREVIAALRGAGCEVFIISGGLLQAVVEFARWLGLPSSNVRAVPVEFDRLAGKWWHYHRDRYTDNPDELYMAFAPTPLAETQGKQTAITELVGQGAQSILVGDGITDLEAREVVGLFVGFGGVVQRKRVMDEADAFIASAGLASVLPLSLSSGQTQALKNTQHMSLLEKGMAEIGAGLVKFGNTAWQGRIERRLRSYKGDVE